MSEPCRVLYHHRIRADDGQAVHVRELITALRRGGHTVDECALVPKATDAEPADRDQGLAPSVEAAQPRRSSLWQALSLPRSAVEVLEVLYNRTGRRMLRRAAARARPDFVYERHALHCHAGLDVARELGVPLLLEVNSPMVVEMQRLGKLTLPRRARATERRVLREADAVLAVTRVLADMLIEAGADEQRVHVIGNGAVPERYDDAARRAAVEVRARLAVPEQAFVLGFVGYMRPWHRLDLVLEAMASEALRPLVLVLMGEGPALGPLREQAERLGLRDRVHVLGVVPPAILPTHVLALDAALIPAINAYASPLKLFDSLAAGVVTLAPDQPNLRENLRHDDNGILFRPDDGDDLRHQLVRLVQDRELSRRIGEAGRRSLLEHRWTWAGNADRVVDVFRSLTRVGSAR